MKAIIIDDERNGREILTTLIKENIPNITLTIEASTIEKGIELIASNEPDIVFLDIELQHGTGFDILDAPSVQNVSTHVIFTTAYENYGIKAIKYSAVDYLLKPIDIDELKIAVERIVAKKTSTISDLLEHIRLPNNERIKLVSREGFDVISCADILYCKSESNYTHFFLDNGRKLLVSKTMKTYQQQLEENGFLRIHKSHIVNLSKIVKYIHGKTGQVQMSDSTCLDVSKEQKSVLIERI